MLICDDDDDVFEETDLAMQNNDDDVPTVTSESSDVADEVIDVSSLKPADFALLPLVTELLQAHRSGDVHGAEQKMVELRRAARRVDRRLAALHHAVSEPAAEPEAAEALLQARTDLLARTKRARSA